ncbi:MAG: hypothetical protein ACOYEV_00600 [Candidatus Nanopelagicales bacterium]
MDLKAALKSLSPEGWLSRLPNPRDTIISAIDRLPVAREAAYPFVPGETVDAMVAAVAETTALGLRVAVEYLPAGAPPSRQIYPEAITELVAADQAAGSELVIDLAELGLAGVDDVPAVTAAAGDLCAAADAAGMTVMIAALPHALVDDGLAVHQELLQSYPSTGATLAAALHRTEADCFDMAALNSRVRLIKREGPDAVGVAFSKPGDVDKAYVRCLRILMSGRANAIIATHDRRLVEIGRALAIRSDRARGEYAFQFRRGLAIDVATELCEDGETVSVLVPFGPDWATYMADNIHLHPAAVTQAARAAVKGGAAQSGGEL